MRKFRSKMKKQGGFTLIEMLIVVAIIAILIAVSIPLVGTALERARKATDAANERSAKAEALIMYMTDEDFEPGNYYWYDAANGCLEDTSDGDGYGKCNDHKGQHLWVAVGNGETDGGDADVVYIVWSTSVPSDFTLSDNLDSLDLIKE